MNFYNEFDPKAAAWLRELIKQGLIPAGDVDERSIKEIKPYELSGYTQCHFFAGIGGWSRALELAGWPATRPVGSGSCPCQPFSAAGKGLGEADARHLWPVFFALLVACRELGQPWAFTVFGEQVASKAGLGWLDGVCADLEGAGYAVGAADLCAASASPEVAGWVWIPDEVEPDGGIWVPVSLGPPHIRQRLFWVADAGHEPAGRGSTPGQAEGRWPLGHATGCRNLGGMADTQLSERRPQHGPVEDVSDRDGAGREEAHGELGARGKVRGMGDADRSGLGEQRGSVAVRAQQPSTELRGDTGITMQSPAHSRELHGVTSGGGWSRFDLLPCTDGKARRVESGLAPLVAGLPRGVVPSGDPCRKGYAENTAEARVTRLRGYGNSIVPQPAAEFITAFTDIAS